VGLALGSDVIWAAAWAAAWVAVVDTLDVFVQLESKHKNLITNSSKHSPEIVETLSAVQQRCNLISAQTTRKHLTSKDLELEGYMMDQSE
jgi:hypothetical protein